MNNNDISNFLNKLKEETNLSGVPNYPLDIVSLGAELGLTKKTSIDVAEHLVKSGIAEYKALGNTMIQLR